MVGSNSQLQNSTPIFLVSSLPFLISAPQPGTGNITLLSRDAWHSGHAWHYRYRWSLLGVVCSINIQNGSTGTPFIPPPQETIWKPVAHRLMVSFGRQAGPTFGCALLVWTEPDNWVRVQWKSGLDKTVSTPGVVTRSHKLSKWDTLVATFTDYHWWLNKSRSWINKIVGSHIHG